MNFDFTGKRMLVTGAASGIGRGIVCALAKAKGTVYAVDLNKSSLDELVQEYPTITPIVLDISDWDKTKATIESLDCLDGLVNNAALGGVSTGMGVNKDQMDRVFAVNIAAATNIIQSACKKMIAEKRPGSIVNMSSVGGAVASHNVFAYNVSKAGLDMVTKQFALELGPHNIRVNSIQPTMVRTEGLKKFIAAKPSIETNILERTPLPRTPEVNDIVGPVLYLLSDCSAMVTGTLQPVDAGILCNLTTKQ